MFRIDGKSTKGTCSIFLAAGNQHHPCHKMQSVLIVPDYIPSQHVAYQLGNVKTAPRDLSAISCILRRILFVASNPGARPRCSPVGPVNQNGACIVSGASRVPE